MGEARCFQSCCFSGAGVTRARPSPGYLEAQRLLGPQRVFDADHQPQVGAFDLAFEVQDRLPLIEPPLLVHRPVLFEKGLFF